MLSLQRVSRRGLNPYMRPVAALLSRIVPWAAIVATDRNKLNPVLQDQWDSGELAFWGQGKLCGGGLLGAHTDGAQAWTTLPGPQISVLECWTLPISSPSLVAKSPRNGTYRPAGGAHQHPRAKRQ